MTSEDRPTVRPVTLSRLIEVTHICRKNRRTTEDVETIIDVSHRRARETILEALRVGLISEKHEEYLCTDTGDEFINYVKQEDWGSVSGLLEKNSRQYASFLRVVDSVGPADLSEVLSELKKREENNLSFNQTSVEVLGDWGERTGEVQRHSFSGDYYTVSGEHSSEFSECLLETYDELEESQGVNLRQRHVSIPELREQVSMKLPCTRSAFDSWLTELSKDNVGKVELSGAPMDTGAKESALGIKEMELSEEDGLVSTSQSTKRVMSGIEQYGKDYYYFAVYDRDIQHTEVKNE
jgi:hypothetical protein